MKHHLVLRVITKLLIPPILIFALYVQFHGDYGPGGGFQAGVIFGAAFILYSLVFGLDSAKRTLPPNVSGTLMAVGVIIFAGVGVATLILGENYLDYDVLAAEVPHGQHYGVLLVEFGVGVTVSATMVTIFYMFAGRQPFELGDEDW